LRIGTRERVQEEEEEEQQEEEEEEFVIFKRSVQPAAFFFFVSSLCEASQGDASVQPARAPSQSLPLTKLQQRKWAQYAAQLIDQLPVAVRSLWNSSSAHAFGIFAHY